MFSIVEFGKKGGIAVVPTNWIQSNKTECIWPPFKSTQSTYNAVKKQLLPREGETWKSCEIIKIFRQKYDSFDGARKNLNKATIQSDFSTDTEPEVKRRRTQVSVKAKFLEPSSEPEQSECPKKRSACNYVNNNLLPPPPPPPIEVIRKNTKYFEDSTSKDLTTTELASPAEFSLTLAGNSSSSEICFEQGGSIIGTEEEIRTAPVVRAQASSIASMSNVTQTQGFIQVVAEKLSEIQESLKNLHAKVDSNTSGGYYENNSEFEDDEYIRAGSVEQLESISKNVLENPGYKKKLILHLCSVSGRSCTKFLNRMLAEIMTDEVAVNYSYKGQRGKHCFEDLQLKSLLVCCMKRNPVTRKSSLAFDIELGIGDWLKRARQRLERKNKKTAVIWKTLERQEESSGSEDEQQSDSNSDSEFV